MNPGSVEEALPEPGREALIERYEALRGEGLARGREPVRGTWGLAILLTRGMAEWASVWVHCAEATSEAVRQVERQAQPDTLPTPVGCEEVVRVLAGMVWAIQKEARA